MTHKTRGIWIAGNWKMNHGPSEAEGFFTQLGRELSQWDARDLAVLKAHAVRALIFAPYLSLDRSVETVKRLKLPFQIGAQNAHGQKKGAFTGEVSALMLQEANIAWSLVGHSERRQLFGESSLSAAERTQGLLEQGIRVMFCLGETRAQREAGQTMTVLAEQLKPLFEAVPQRELWDGRLVLAYEPVWAIGTGLTATPAEAEEAHQAIRRMIWDALGMEASGRTPLLYGGSVTPENIQTLIAQPNIDGGLIGGASLKVESYLKLLRAGVEAAHGA